MADAKITLTLTPKEFDLMRVILRTRRDDAISTARMVQGQAEQQEGDARDQNEAIAARERATATRLTGLLEKL